MPFNPFARVAEVTPEPPEPDDAGEQTGEPTGELASPATEAGAAGEEPWPSFDSASAAGAAVQAPDRSARAVRDDDVPGEGGFGLSASVILLLLLGLAAVTFGGIVVGRAVQPADTVATTLTTTSVPITTTTTATATATPTTPPATTPRPAAVRLGPISATVIGHFAPSGRASAALAGSRLVVAGGVGSARVLAGPVGGRLKQVGALTSPRADAAVFALGGAVYVLGGEQGSTPTAQIARVDLSSGRVAPAGSFEEPLAEAAVAVKGNAAYIVGGWTGQKYATAVLRYTPGAAPALVARLPVGLRSPAVTIAGNTLIVAGGLGEQGLSRQVYGVDLASGAVKALSSLAQGVERATLLPVGPALYLLGGTTGQGAAFTGVVRIDPTTGHATPLGTMASPPSGAIAIRAPAYSLLVDPARGVVYRIG